MPEDLHTEYKEARTDLPKSLFDTVCAFLNTDGGTVYLGINDQGMVTGVEKETVPRLKREIADISNNPQKLDPPYLLFPKEEQREGKTIIVLQVPLSSQIHRHKGQIYLRSEDGDYHVKSTHQLAGLLNRKLGIFPEQTPMTSFSMQDLRPELFDRARELMRARNQKHPWLAFDDTELLHVAGLFAESSTPDAPVLTLAAILLFGNDLAIQRAAPAYKFDCLLRRRNIDRYDDRLMIRTNLIDAYDQMMDFVEKHLNDPFYLEGDISISLRERIFREAISNIIAHRDYRNATPGRLMIYEDRVILDNPSTQYFHQPITPQNLASHPKNPSICKFMIQLGRFDELGSGVINIHKYLPAYSDGAQPLFEDTREGFRLTLPLSLLSEAKKKTSSVAGKSSGAESITDPVEAPVEAPVTITETGKRILASLRDNTLGRKDILTTLGYRQPTGNYKTAIENLLSQGLIERTIPDKPTSRLQKYRLTEKGRKLISGTNTSRT
ncbi:MAG: putative DNA binding domain-containing protein [Opitutales bacterium]|nr:putative DNA binding domain-containing protein [Opitutales bacterium]